jgi:heme-degrading monooxygenase HmoA
LNVIPSRGSEFEAAFAQARQLISAMPGFLSLELGCNTQVPNQRVLLVKWRSVKDHTEGFRRSQVRRMEPTSSSLFDPFPTVEYYREVS